MNKNSQHVNQNRLRLRSSNNKAALPATEESFDRARESALLMLAQLSLSKMVAQIKKH